MEKTVNIMNIKTGYTRTKTGILYVEQEGTNSRTNRYKHDKVTKV